MIRLRPFLRLLLLRVMSGRGGTDVGIASNRPNDRSSQRRLSEAAPRLPQSARPAHFTRVPSSRSTVILVVVLFALTMVGAVLSQPIVRAVARGNGSPSPVLEQCANRTTPCNWQVGILNGANAGYLEGNVVPFRLSINDLPSGPHTLHIQYDFSVSGNLAYDFLAAYDATEHADACAGANGSLALVCHAPLGPATSSIPSDPYEWLIGSAVSGAEAASGTPRDLVLYGGAIDRVDPPVHTMTRAGEGVAEITLMFTTTSSDVLLLWGGHLADAAYWGASDGSAAISTDHWQMRVTRLDDATVSESVSMQPNALVGVMPTPTDTATFTATPTDTPRPTETATPTSTAATTPTPTDTAIAPATATSAPTATDTPQPATPTATATNAPPTPTTTPTNAPPTATATIGSPSATATIAPASPRVIFGLGPEANSAEASPLNRDAPLGMYSSWYNGSADLDWMRYWHTSGFIQNNIYGTGRAAHLIIWSDVPNATSPVCGRPYPVSEQILTDMQELAADWAGSATDPPLYVTLFTEFQTYPCVEDQWTRAEDYYTLLKQRMIQIRDIFHQNAPNARVSIGWGGWQTRWDDPANGGGSSLIPYFADVMSQMDFQSTQIMNNDTNVNDATGMVTALGAYGPVMVAHYKPENTSDTTFAADMSAMMTDTFLGNLVSRGLFAWSFMDQACFDDMANPIEAANYDVVVNAVRAFGRSS